MSIVSSQSLFKLMSIELVMSSNQLILCHPLLSMPPVFPGIRVISNESVLCIYKVVKYWSLNLSFSFNISLPNEYSGLIDRFDLLTVQGTLKSLLQDHSSKALILWHTASCIVQILHPYRTTSKNIALTVQTLVSKVMSLLLVCCLGLS